MSLKVFRRRRVVVWGVAVLLSVLAGGCSSGLKEKRSEPVVGELRGGGKYYHFDDVLVPGELKYDQKNSFIYETPRFKTGVMVFTKYWLDVESLIQFFTYHMEKDNWKLVNSFRGKESMLSFAKPDKSCTIRITEKWTGTTVVEIRVGPLAEKKM